jgi:hypothetical protein
MATPQIEIYLRPEARVCLHRSKLTDRKIALNALPRRKYIIAQSTGTQNQNWHAYDRPIKAPHSPHSCSLVLLISNCCFGSRGCQAVWSMRRPVGRQKILQPKQNHLRAKQVRSFLLFANRVRTSININEYVPFFCFPWRWNQTSRE